ncbi:hypothetical protein [Myroides sp. N17-2]|uniref:hypothetical protein n=1 Tax=Myroides sp. N17-2 TaxID=2030799 RepID=UPI000EFB379A|nr:hypothetical protein [Myroides sp. N17-2]
MSLLINENLLIPFPQKIDLSIQFSYEIVDIHNSFDYLEELWDEIISTISTSIQDRGITFLKGKTNINDTFTIIAYDIIILGIPPSLNLAFIYDELSSIELPNIFTIYTPNHYNHKVNDILIHTN